MTEEILPQVHLTCYVFTVESEMFKTGQILDGIIRKKTQFSTIQ
jgi:hypothetical protein